MIQVNALQLQSHLSALTTVDVPQWQRLADSSTVLCTDSTHNAVHPAPRRLTCDCCMRREAEAGGFWSYVAGTAYKVATEHIVGGMQLENYRTTLPLKKGLSSSAAICVLVSS